MVQLEEKEAVKEADATAWVYAAVRRMILDHELVPGCKINQGKLAQELDVSRTPVVKALHKLEMEGLVENTPQKGFFVHQFTILELRNVFALREAIEAMAVDDLAGDLTDAQIEELAACFAPFGTGAGSIDAAAYARADRAFHGALLRMCRNNLARKVDRSFQILARTYRVGLVREPAETFPEHMAVLAALRARDGEKARAAMVAHIRRTRELLDDVIGKLHKLGVDPATLPVQDIPSDLLRGEGLP